VGVDVREESNVTACEFTPDAAILDVVSRVDGATGRARVRALIDATGRGGLIARKFDLRTHEPRLANIAIYSHYTGVPRLEGQRPDDIRLVARTDAGWFWLIPISKELTSVGVVLPKTLYQSLAHDSPEELLNRTICDTPIIADLMRDARREWPVRVEKDFSYSASTYAGDRWVLAGDAGSFLDPVFSTGVSIAMESGIEAAEVLDRARLKNDFSAARFAAFSRRQHTRFRRFRRFVVGFYTPQFRDIFFSPEPPKLLFRSVATILAGKWDSSLQTRFLNQLFFCFVSVQKHFNLTGLNFRRDPDAGYPT
jgi:flavin-dependent dehydrogenase